MAILKNKILLSFLFLALVLRFRYFPNDINFAYDQARDAFVSLEVARGDLITVGPPTTFFGIHHGALFYYLFAPFYFLGNGSPLPLAIFLRVLNALGVFLVFLIGKNLFNNKTGYIASFLYAISFEQTQFSLFLAHPSPAVFTSLFFFWGLSEVVFNKKSWGLLIASLGLSLSTQFHFSMFILFLTSLVFLITHRKEIIKTSRMSKFASLILTSVFLGSFIVAELKFGFSNARHSVELVENILIKNSHNLLTLLKVVARYFRHNVFNLAIVFDINLVLFLIVAFIANYKKQFLFLGLWFLTGLLTFLPDSPIQPRYVNAMGTSVALIIFISFLISKIKTTKIVLLILILITYSNIKLITKYNKFGTISEVNAQEKMLLSDEKKLINYIYKSANGDSFSVNAITIPYKVNTTWSYLFEWYGKQKYGYLPVWAGENAEGFEGNLEVNTKRSEGPVLHFTIIEPSRGIDQFLIKSFLEEENNFTNLAEEKHFGALVVQKRIKI